MHTIGISATEKVDKEKSKGTTIGTSVAITAIIRIFVPYPGRYLEISLRTNDVNIGELVNLELSINSEGKENITANPQIEILSIDNKTIEILYLGETFIQSQRRLELSKTLNTSNYNPGKYIAIASVDYGKVAISMTNFRIGYLFINITDYTRQIFIKGLETEALSNDDQHRAVIQYTPTAGTNGLNISISDVFAFKADNPAQTGQAVIEVAAGTGADPIIIWQQVIPDGYDHVFKHVDASVTSSAREFCYVRGSTLRFALDGTKILMQGLPTADPSNTGQLWSNSGVLTVS